MDVQYETAESETQMIILAGRTSPWGLLVDRTDGLADLEISYTSLNNQEQSNWSRAIAGTATYEQHVIEILETDVIHHHTCDLLDSFWSGSTHLETPESN